MAGPSSIQRICAGSKRAKGILGADNSAESRLLPSAESGKITVKGWAG